MIGPVQHVVEYTASLLGASADDLKLVLAFLLSYPLVALMIRIPDHRPRMKVVYTLCVSAMYLLVLFDMRRGLADLIIAALGTYAITACLRDSPLMPWIGFVFLMGHLSVSQLARQRRADPTTVDITGAQMVLVLKLGAFCWNVADGRLPLDQLSDFQRDHALTDLPPLLEYLGYVFFFPALFAGPAFDYAEYRRWLDMSMFGTFASADSTNPSLKSRKYRTSVRKGHSKLSLIPRADIPAARKAAAGLMWLALFVTLAPKYDFAQVLTPSYAQVGLIQRIWILYMVGLTARLKFYAVWSLTEGSCILTGIGFGGWDPTTGRPLWNRLQNIDPWVVETAQNPRSFISGWNINTNTWLRSYVYLRVTPRGHKPGFIASLITFTTSALWHGYYPGYYLSFVLASFVQTVAPRFHRLVRPFFLDPTTGRPTRYKFWYDVLSLIVTQMTFSFIAAPFLVLTLRDSLLVWSRVYFYLIVGVAVSMAFFASPAAAHLQAALDARQRRARLIEQKKKGT